MVGLASGEVAYLAREGAVVEIEAVLQGGPRVFLASGTRPPSWMSRAVVTRLSGRDGEWSVSYTHLDVYKRQLASCAAAAAGRRSGP